MIVTVQISNVLVVICRIPELDCQIGATRCQEDTTSRATIVDILHSSRVAFDCLFQFAEFPVPYFDSAIIGPGGNGGEYWMESNAVYRISV